MTKTMITHATREEWMEAHLKHKGLGLRVLKELCKVTYPKRYSQTRYPFGRTYTDKTANALTKAIIKYIEYRGFQAERISSSGRMIKQGAKMIYIPGTSRNGTADISGTIHGRSIKIEVKIGKDRQSDHQKAYQQEVERAGGIYLIAKDFQSFYETINTVIDAPR